MPPHATHPPSLASLFLGFVRIGLVSFGGGLAAWTRREVVERRGWLDDTQFISGYALSQLVPGATNVNLAVFIGTELRGPLGALACFWGLTLVPLIIVLGLGALYFGIQHLPIGRWFSDALAGMGAVAIGMNLGLGIRLARRNLRGAAPIALVGAITLAIGVLGFRLPIVLACAMPTSLVIAWFGRPR
jgi:chromate transporter